MREPSYIEQFSLRSVRHIGVEDEIAVPAHDLGDQLGEFLYRDVLAHADVEMLFALVVLQSEDHGVGEVVDVEELAAGRSRSPDLDRWGVVDLGLVDLP